MLNSRQADGRALRRRSLLLAVLAFFVVMIVWQVDALNPLLYPFRFYVTSVHELGHGLSSLLSGGQFLGYEVYESGAGVATTSGGWRWVIIPAGYVGTAVFGGVLLYLTNRTRFTKLVAMALGVFFAALTLVFGRSITALLAGLATGGLLILLGWRGPLWLNAFVLNVLAFITGLNAVLDLWGLLGSLNSRVLVGTTGVPNDAYSMAHEIGLLPAAGWAVVWIIVALLCLGFSAWVTFVRPVRQRQL